MIEGLAVYNFQSHEGTCLTLHPGVNAIVGPTDSGKSALLRALRWVLRNKPDGKDFIQSGKDICMVELHLPDGIVVTRRRTATKNEYLVEHGDVEDVFAGMGGTVPPAVAELLETSPVEFGDGEERDFNIARQMDPLFFLSEKPSTRAKLLGRISGIDRIDAAIQKANQLRRVEEQTQEQQRISAEQLQVQLDAVPDPEPLLRKVAEVRGQAEAVAELDYWAVELRRASDEWAATELELSRAQKKAKGLVGISSLARWFEDCLNFGRATEGLAALKFSTEQAQGQLALAERRAEALAGLPRLVLEARVQAALGDSMRDWEGWLQVWALALRDVVAAETALEDSERKLKGALDDFNSQVTLGLPCPTCGQPLTQEGVDHLSHAQTV
jgi:DNA repair exonuclease SbcCD ATPase subunit